jgi:[acyl-carrier-protein] S-malonyltransferase
MKGKVVFIFPGQGSQYPGMGKDFFFEFSEAKRTFEEAEDILHTRLTSIVFEGPESSLNETANSQVGIFVTSIAIWRVIQEFYPNLEPDICAGLSLGEYSALVASKRLEFGEALHLVNRRAQLMNKACELTKGTMAVVLGLEGDQVEEIVVKLNLPQELWVANFNAPGQVVISGTQKGIDAGIAAVKAGGAKRVLPLAVHGAFHSGLMQSAENELTPDIEQAVIKESPIRLVMNVPGDFVADSNQIRKFLIKQVTSPVRWEKGIRSIEKHGIDLYVEIGCGKTLTGLNKRIAVTAPTVSVEKVDELKNLEQSSDSH